MVHYTIAGTILSGIAVYAFLAQFGDLMFNAAAWMLKLIMTPNSGNVFTNFNFYSPASASGNPFLGLVMPYFYGNGTTDAGYNLFRICWMLFAILAALQILKTFRDPSSRGNAAPGRTLIWILISAGLMVGGHFLLGQLLEYFSTFMNGFAGALGASVESLDNNVNLLYEWGIISEPSDYILTCIVAAGLAATTMAAGITYIERYLSFAVTAYLAPIAFACASNDDMRDTFKLWVQSMLEQAFGIFLSVAMLALAIKALTTPDSYFLQYKVGFWTRKSLDISILKCTSATVILAFCKNIEKFLNVIGFKTMPNGEAAKSFLAGAGAIGTAWSMGNSLVSPFANRVDAATSVGVGNKLADASKQGGVKGALAKAASFAHDAVHPGERTARMAKEAATASDAARAAAPSKLDGAGKIARNPKGDPKQAVNIDKQRAAAEAMSTKDFKAKNAKEQAQALKPYQMSSEAMAKATFSQADLDKFAEAGTTFDSFKNAEYATDKDGNVYGVMHGHTADGHDVTAYSMLSGKNPPTDGAELTTVGGSKYTTAGDGAVGLTKTADDNGTSVKNMLNPDVSKPGNVSSGPHYDPGADNQFKQYFGGSEPGGSSQPIANPNLNTTTMENSGFDHVVDNGKTITMEGQVAFRNDSIEGQPIQDTPVAITYDKETGTGSVELPDGSQHNATFAQDDSGNVHVMYDSSTMQPGDQASMPGAQATMHPAVDEARPMNPFNDPANPKSHIPDDVEPEPDEGEASRINRNRKNDKNQDK